MVRVRERQVSLLPSSTSTSYSPSVKRGSGSFRKKDLSRLLITLRSCQRWEEGKDVRPQAGQVPKIPVPRSWTSQAQPRCPCLHASPAQPSSAQLCPALPSSAQLSPAQPSPARPGPGPSWDPLTPSSSQTKGISALRRFIGGSRTEPPARS